MLINNKYQVIANSSKGEKDFWIYDITTEIIEDINVDQQIDSDQMKNEQDQ